MNNYKKYKILWFSQGISELGSSLTSFTLSLWIYETTGSAFSWSLFLFCWFLPLNLTNLIAGGIIERNKKKNKKKNIMLISDSVSILITFILLIFIKRGKFSIAWFYIANIIGGIASTFQYSAQDTIIAILVPKEKLGEATGLEFLSGNIVNMITPILATVLYSFSGLKLVFLIDFLSFLITFMTLLFLVEILENLEEIKGESLKVKIREMMKENKQGFIWLRENSSILIIVLTMTVMNFFSRITYQNILSPMILAKSNGDNKSLGLIITLMGVAGILGGFAVSLKKSWKAPIKFLLISMGVSFLLGDLLLAVGSNIKTWSLGVIFASFPIPFILASQRYILYSKVSEHLRGRIFSAKNGIQYFLIPLGLLLGGFLADRVFEPFMLKTKSVF